MTLTKYDRVAIIPKRCDKCNRLFWLEGYNVFYKVVGIEHYSLEQIECKKCMQSEERRMSKLLIGLSANSGKFGVIPDPPEPEETECNGEYIEGSCECCDRFEQCLIIWREDEE